MLTEEEHLYFNRLDESISKLLKEDPDNYHLKQIDIATVRIKIQSDKKGILVRKLLELIYDLYLSEMSTGDDFPKHAWKKDRIFELATEGKYDELMKKLDIE